MRVKKTLFNSIYAICSYAFIGILGLILRKFFLVYLPTDFLGYEGLFYDLFAIMSIADLGVAGIIQYRLYEAIAKDDKSNVSRIMAVYKVLYRIIGFGILCIGLLLIPFLKIIIKNNSLQWSFVYLIYLMQLASTLCNYFLAYKRIMIVANLQEATITKIETACTFSSYIVKIAVILIFKNYIMYLAISILNNIVANAIIAHKVDRDYPYIREKIKITKKDIQELKIGADLKNNLVQKICMAIYGGTDSILITALIGIEQTGLMSNYSLISGQISNVLTKLLNPFSASIANYVHDDSHEMDDEMFHMFDRIGFFLACFISTSFMVLYNPFIALIFGEKFVMSETFVLAFVINQYITYNHKFLACYRGAFGRFELDKPYTAAAAGLNLVFSIILAKPLGVAGIMLGTAIGHMGFWIGRARVVYAVYMKESVNKYVLRQLVNVALCSAEMGFTYWICSLLPNTVGFFIVRTAACLVIPNVINFLLFCKSQDMKLIFEYVGKVRSSLRPAK